MQSRFSRREFLAGLGALTAAGATRRLWANPVFTRAPFTLGVASGYPTTSGFALWTRLAPTPLAPDGGMPASVVPVRWEVANDDGFREIVRTGVSYATPEWAHSVHVEVEGLEAERWYWYRFHAGDATSTSGRTRTAPAIGAPASRLRFALASCQHYEHGYYSAYRHMLQDELDLILHVGDYIYESSWGSSPVRRHEGPEPIALEDYRARYARYKLDPDLQAAHALCPWLVTWDDHEVENDYADEISENDDDPRWFRHRRAAAYQAYYEHMPLRRQMLPFGAGMRIHTRVPFGALAEFTLLDDRQYRTRQPCPKPGRAGSNLIADCAERLNPAATLLGARQEAWLAAGLAAASARWNVLAQQTLMAQADGKAGPGQQFYSDGWDGYPAARQRLLGALAATKPANPVVLGGDVHSFWVTDLKLDFDDAQSPVVASEFVTTSITSQPPPEERIRTAMNEGSHIHFATGKYRGYTRFDLTPARLQAELRALADATKEHSGCETLSTWVVVDGRPGPQAA